MPRARSPAFGLFFSWCAALLGYPTLVTTSYPPLRRRRSSSSLRSTTSTHFLLRDIRTMSLLRPGLFARLPLARTSLRSFTSTSLASSSSSSATSSDPRPPSSRIFTPDEVSAGMKALAAAGYDSSSIWEQRVCWGDHDQFQHVNNVHFVRWFESSRMFFTQILTSELPKERQDEISKGTGKSFILAGINVRYRRPVVYPDTVSSRSPSPSLLLMPLLCLRLLVIAT